MRSRSNLFKVIFMALVLCVSIFRGAAAAELSSGPVLGDVSAEHARLWMNIDREATVDWKVSRSKDLSADISVRQSKAPAGNRTMKIEGLLPQTRYFYNIFIDEKAVFDKELPSFTTVPEETVRGRVRIAFTSCLGKNPQDSRRGWSDMAVQDIDALILLGDQHYANTTDPRILEEHYLAYREDEAFQGIARQKPVYAIWDDHDYAGNDKDGTASGKEDSLAVFKAVWPNPSFGSPDDQGIYHSFKRSGVEFFMLDGRYHRSPKKWPDSAVKTQLGPKQLAWLKQGLKSSTARVKVIASGVEFNAGAGKDSWSFYLHERKEIIDFIIAHKIEGVIFISGDSHYTAGFQMKEGFIEITAGPLGSQPNAVSKNPYVFKALPRGRYYVVLDIDTSADVPRISWQARGFSPEGTPYLADCGLDWQAVLRKKPARCQ